MGMTIVISILLLYSLKIWIILFYYIYEVLNILHLPICHPEVGKTEGSYLLVRSFTNIQNDIKRKFRCKIFSETYKDN